MSSLNSVSTPQYRDSLLSPALSPRGIFTSTLMRVRVVERRRRTEFPVLTFNRNNEFQQLRCISRGFWQGFVEELEAGSVTTTHQGFQHAKRVGFLRGYLINPTLISFLPLPHLTIIERQKYPCLLNKLKLILFPCLLPLSSPTKPPPTLELIKWAQPAELGRASLQKYRAWANKTAPIFVSGLFGSSQKNLRPHWTSPTGP